jgi:small-conductance mechanosensitive channel
MNRTSLRVLSGAAGIITTLVAIFYSLLFLSNEFQEAESAYQWTNHKRIGLAIAILAVLVFAAVSGYLACRLLRFAFTGQK